MLTWTRPPTTGTPNTPRTSWPLDDPNATTQLVSKGFARVRKVSELAPRIQELTHSACGRAAWRWGFDFVHGFADLLPMDVVSNCST